MSKIKKKQFELVSNDSNVISLIENLKANQSLYKKIINTLLSLGIFDKSINCNFYEINKDEEQGYIKLWCEDIDGNIYIFCPKSNIKQDLNIVQKISNDSEKKYDVTLFKKFDITNSNVELMRTESAFNFKFGRLITDTTTFYNLFLSDNICHQLQLNGNETPIDIKVLLSQLNKLENMPTLKEYIEVFDNVLSTNNIQYETISMASYKNFKNLGSLTIINEESKQKRLTKHKDS